VQAPFLQFAVDVQSDVFVQLVTHAVSESHT